MKPKSETNAFGGANPHGLYVPLTDLEQEAISRLVEADDLEVVIHGWGLIPKPKVSFGDLRVSIPFTLTFNAPDVPQPLHYLDLELRTRAGMTLFRQRQPTIYGGQPIMVGTGVVLDFAWDIALHHIDPKIVKALVPGAVGLTSRRLDKETGEATFAGNMRLNGEQKKLLRQVEAGNREIRATDAQKVVAAVKAAGEELRVTDKGIVTR